MKKTIVFDFDGVIHRYKDGWQDGSIYDIPTPGIGSILETLKEKGYEIAIVSTRCKSFDGINAIQEWLQFYELDSFIDMIRADKPPALVYIDDRALKFDGNQIELLIDQIENFSTWQGK